MRGGNVFVWESRKFPGGAPRAKAEFIGFLSYLSEWFYSALAKETAKVARIISALYFKKIWQTSVWKKYGAPIVLCYISKELQRAFIKRRRRGQMFFLMAPEDCSARFQNENAEHIFLSVILTMAGRRFSEKSADRQRFFCFRLSNNFIKARGKIINFFAVVMRPSDFVWKFLFFEWKWAFARGEKRLDRNFLRQKGVPFARPVSNS